MLHTNLDTLLFCRNLQCRKLLQISEYGGPRVIRFAGWVRVFFGQLFLSTEEALIFRQLFSAVKVIYVLILTKNGLGYILGNLGDQMGRIFAYYAIV
jgi:hypothetical protein